eukprot:s3371_g6.t1
MSGSSGSRTRPVKSGRRRPPKEPKEAKEGKAEGKKATTRERPALRPHGPHGPHGARRTGQVVAICRETARQAAVEDKDLRVFLEARVGAVVTCFVIRDDYGIAKFQKEEDEESREQGGAGEAEARPPRRPASNLCEDARRCLQDRTGRELNGTDFNGSTLKVQAGKPKRGAPAKGKQAATSEMDQDACRRASLSLSFCKANVVAIQSVSLSGPPFQERLPGGCGIEDQNARRALDSLTGADMNGHTITASLRALELSRQSSKAGRLIVRNLSFDARETLEDKREHGVRGGDFLSEKYQGLAAGSSKEACELFAEAEDLLGQEQFDTLEIPAMWAEAAEKARAALKAFRAAGSAGTADAARLVVKALVGDKIGEAKMLTSFGEANSAKEGKAKAEAIGSVKEARSIFRNQGAKEWEAKALLTLAGINLEKDSDLGAVETALKNATEARLASHVYG